MKKFGYSLVFLALLSIVIPASAQNQNISDETLKILEEILACKASVDADKALTVAEKTVAKRNCETIINNKYSDMNNDHRYNAELKHRLEVMQKCVDWYPSYRFLDEVQWRVQKNLEQASDCIIVYKDSVWNYSGENRLEVLAERLLELKAKQNETSKPIVSEIVIPSEASQVAQDTRSDKMAELEAKIAELQAQLRKKEEVIREQLKVIIELVNMLRNVVLESFLSNVIHF